MEGKDNLTGRGFSVTYWMTLLLIPRRFFLSKPRLLVSYGFRAWDFIQYLNASPNSLD